jgi:hypothetical protein
MPEGYLPGSDQQIQAFGDQIRGDCLDHGTAAHAQLDLDQPLLLQHPQRFPQGAAAGLHHLFEFAFGGKPVAHLQMTLDDGFLNLFHHILEYPVLFGNAKQWDHRSAARSWVTEK